VLAFAREGEVRVVLDERLEVSGLLDDGGGEISSMPSSVLTASCSGGVDGYSICTLGQFGLF
jgi:hypothetical protein